MDQVNLSCNLDLEPESEWLTVTAAQVARASIAYVQELGDFRCGPDYFTRRENLPSYLIKLCLGGEGTLDYEGGHYTLRAGDIFWIDCRKPQYYQTTPPGKWHILWVHFYGGPCDAYYQLFLTLNDGKNVARLESDVSARSILEMLLKLYRDGVNTLQDDVEASSLLTQLMALCIQAANAGNENVKRIPGYVLDTRNYINLHYAERITLDDLARSISINKFYLQKLFKRYFGLSPNEYLIHTRLTRAKELLRTTAAPVSQIAMDVGVNNIGHFNALFKRLEGITPSAYRQRWYQLGDSELTDAEPPRDDMGDAEGEHGG